jgi:hypothetical protein
VAKSPKRLLPMHLLCEKLSDARAMATTIELALAGIDPDMTNERAAELTDDNGIGDAGGAQEQGYGFTI